MTAFLCNQQRMFSHLRHPKAGAKDLIPHLHDGLIMPYDLVAERSIEYLAVGRSESECAFS